MKQKKKLCYIYLLILFLVVSILFINPITMVVKPELHSNQLRKVIVKDKDVERIDYVDSNGRITMAANLGYATIIITENEEGKQELYFDERGEPSCGYNGYYGIVRKYDEESNILRITYLNQYSEPIIMANGYATEVREYNKNKQVESVKYYDTEDKPIFTPLFGYGKINEYDEKGNIKKITCIDASGHPMMNDQGYAVVMLYYYESDGPENKMIESEFYYDETENPVSLSIGQYGIHKEYDEYGRASLITYLDANGEPIVTNRGYTSIVRQYHPDGSIFTEQYYDIDGLPFSLSEGQYGIRRNKNQTEYLNQDGEIEFNLKNLLYNHSWIVIPATLLLIILSGMTKKILNCLLLIGCMCIIGYFTLMFREYNDIKAPRLFLSYEKIFSDSEVRGDILKNIWLFIPLGAILFQLYPRKIILLVPIALSFIIEIIQYITGIGYCELDDIISNSLGGLIGFAAGKLTTDIKLRIKTCKHIHLSKEGFKQ